MSASGLDAIDKTLQTTDNWRDEIMETIRPDRQLARHLLEAVPRTMYRRSILCQHAAHRSKQDGFNALYDCYPSVISQAIGVITPAAASGADTNKRPP